jgi:hypothetical protein
MIRVSTRVVFIFKNFVIKFPISRRGYLQGKNERYIWNKYKDYFLLAPLKWERFGIICQSRCKSVGYEKFSTNYVRLVKNIMPEFNIENCDLYNIKNWGVYNDYVVLLDYGVNEEISKMY